MRGPSPLARLQTLLDTRFAKLRIPNIEQSVTSHSETSTGGTGSSGHHRPRNVGWARAAALLYGDWGTSKAYATGLASVAAVFPSFPFIIAVCALTGLVGYNYIIICKHYPD